MHEASANTIVLNFDNSAMGCVTSSEKNLTSLSNIKDLSKRDVIYLCLRFLNTLLSHSFVSLVLNVYYIYLFFLFFLFVFFFLTESVCYRTFAKPEVMPTPGETEGVLVLETSDVVSVMVNGSVL